jgi:hypothetical protein
MTGVTIPAEAGIFSLRGRVRAGSASQPASYPAGARVSLSGWGSSLATA